MFRILVVEDDAELRGLFRRVLEKNGYEALEAADGQQALDVLDENYIDLIISDIMMPVMDGYELVRSLREADISIPVLMITAKDAFDDMRRGFLSGTDDYMVKPVNVNEMVLRVGALLRRAQMISERREVLGGTTLVYDTLTIQREGHEITLPQKEFLLLYKMAAAPGRIFTRQQIMDDIWGIAPASRSWTISGASRAKPTPTPWTCTLAASASASAIIPILRSSPCAGWGIRW